jgi:aquaporin Z
MSRMTDERMLDDWVRPLVVEFIGPFALVFMGVGSILTFGNDVVAVALAHGLAIGLMVVAAGHISGGAYNPAVTLGLVIGRRLPPLKGVAYVIAQLLGAVAAALVLIAIFDKGIWEPANLGTPGVGAKFSSGQAVVMEIVLTFFLMFVIFGSAVDHRSKATMPGIAIGLAITMDIFAGGAVTGAAMNPSRAFGPALVSGTWDDQWIYWLAPAIGAGLAAAVYEFVLISWMGEAPPGRPPGPSTERAG